MHGNRMRWLAVVLPLLWLQGCAARSDVTAGDGDEPGRRNVILFLGDGMGISTITAARIFAGQRQGGSGEEYQLPFDRFPHVALIKTYNTDAQVADSAGTMTAIMTGEKTRIGFINVAAGVEHGDCIGALANQLPSLLQLAENHGFASGIVTTTRVTHATPAATYAHAPDRNWESDAQLSPAAAAAGCRDLARQLVEFDHGDGIDVVLAGGRAAFLPESAADPEYPDATGTRRDGRNLIEEWLAGADGRHFVWNADQFAGLSSAAGQVLGLFEPSHMQYEADRGNDGAGEPSLAEMTRFAIDRLRHAPRGYFLMVEGGRIDHAHHAGNAYRALVETIAMADAVTVAVQGTDPRNTLILVTADHSHTLSISGYPKRGNPILGLVETPWGKQARDLDGRPYTTLSYANGPGHRPRPAAGDDSDPADPEDPDYKQVAAVPMHSETHAGEDVPAYATGFGADGVRGVMEQNELFTVLRRALLGDR